MGTLGEAPRARVMSARVYDSLVASIDRADYEIRRVDGGRRSQ